MSLAETQQIFLLLTEIDALLDKIETKTVTTEKKLQRVATQTVLVNQILLKTLNILRRMGLPEEINSVVMKLQRLIGIANQMRLVIYALNAAMMGTPAGAILAGLGMIMVALDVGDILMGSG